MGILLVGHLSLGHLERSTSRKSAGVFFAKRAKIISRKRLRLEIMRADVALQHQILPSHPIFCSFSHG